MTRDALYGVLAEFRGPDELLEAARRASREGYRRMDAYSPLTVEGLAEALGFRRTRMSLVMLLSGLAGGCGGYLLQYWVSVIDYPLNVGGRPLHSWPAFIPVTFELTVLGAALGGVLGMLALNGLPRPHHPLFAVPRFARATQDAFFLCIEARDANFDYRATRSFLESLEPLEVLDVPQ